MRAKKREELILSRKRKRMSQFEVAMEINMSQAQYSVIENGYRNPNPDVAKRLIEMFNLPEDYFKPGALQEA